MISSFSYLQRLRQRSWIFLFIMLIQLTISYYFLNTRNDSFFKEYLHSFAASLTWATAVTLVLALIRRRWLYRAAMIALVGMNVALYFFEAYMLKMYQSICTDTMVMSILGTNPSEAAQYFNAMPPIRTMLGYMLILVALYVVARLVGKLIGKISLLWHPITVVVLSIIGISLAFSGPYLKAYNQLQEKYPLISYSYFGPVDRLVVSVLHCNQQKEKCLAYYQAMVDVQEYSVSNKLDLPPHNIVLIMGESVNRNFMHCYGYPLATTPMVDTLAQSGDLILFDDVVAPMPNTSLSLPQVLTYYTKSDTLSNWTEFPSLPAVMSQGGYHSYWLSAQEKFGVWVQPVTALSLTADSCFFTTVRGSDENYLGKHVYDEEVLPHLMHFNDLCSRSDKNKLFQLVHLMGSHAQFSDRYPNDFSLFNSDDIINSHPEYARWNQASYCNSIRYTDHIISTIIDQYCNEPSIIIYTADHGLSVHDDETEPEFVGHSVCNPGLEIPFMIYVSPAMQQLMPDLMAQLRQMQHQPYMTDLLTHTITQMVGLRTSYSDPRLEFFSHGYDAKRRRSVTGFGVNNFELPPRYAQ